LRSHKLLLARGPFNLAEERFIIERHGIEVLVAKASGGAATEAKLTAARERDLPVVMVRRPSKPAGERATGAIEALDWLAAQLAGGARLAKEEARP
jgi:precorrin-6A/cobalt-precorrin-6A reductase